MEGHGQKDENGICRIVQIRFGGSHSAAPKPYVPPEDITIRETQSMGKIMYIRSNGKQNLERTTIKKIIPLRDLAVFQHSEKELAEMY
jgi:hypothetical protein